VQNFKIETGKVKKPKSTAVTTKSANVLNELGVARYVDELMAAREDNATFEAIIKRIGKDKTIKLAEARLLAEKFVGGSAKYKTKGAAFKAMLERQIADKRAASRGPQISGIF
jgi:hypothetical protein